MGEAFTLDAPAAAVLRDIVLIRFADGGRLDGMLSAGEIALVAVRAANAALLAADRELFAQAIEARQGGDAEGGSVEDKSAVAAGDVPASKSEDQPPSSTPGEVERLVDAFQSACFRRHIPDARAARTALLSHISTAGRGEEAAYEELDAVSARVQQGWDADESVFDAARLRWLDAQARKSRTGISFDWVPPVKGERSGFRFMRRFFVTEQCDTLKAAIDRAMLEDPEHPNDRKIDPAAESARLVAAITGEAPGPLLAEIAEGRAAHRRALAARLQHRLDAMAERGMESVGISKGFAAELVHALSAADATNPQDQE